MSSTDEREQLAEELRDAGVGAPYYVADKILAQGFRRATVISTAAELEALPHNSALLCEGSRSGEGDLDGVYLKRPAYARTESCRYECGGTTTWGSDLMFDSWTTITAVYIP